MQDAAEVHGGETHLTADGLAVLALQEKADQQFAVTSTAEFAEHLPDQLGLFAAGKQFMLALGGGGNINLQA